MNNSQTTSEWVNKAPIIEAKAQKKITDIYEASPI
jgi:hypothetical protein